MSRQGSVYRRCGKCSARAVAKRCERCGYDKSSWTWVADVHRAGEARRTKMKGGYATKGAAVAALQAELAAREAGSYIEPRNLTLGEYLTRWLPTISREVRPGTVVNYEHTARVVSDALGSVPLQQLTRQAIKTFYAELAGTRAAKTVHNHHLILHRALRDAVEDKLLSVNPADRAHRLAKHRTEMKTWTAAELGAFLAGVKLDRLYGLWRVAAMSGLRRGELLALRWADVALDAGTARIVRAYVRGNAGLHFGEPKTATGRRLIALDPATVAVLKSHRARQAEERLAWGPDYRDADLIFCREDGSPLDPDGVTSRFERRVRELGLPRIRLHDLRHTYATLALAAGIHPKVVQERLGHSSITMTLDLYSHAVPAMQADAADRVAALIDAAG